MLQNPNWDIPKPKDPMCLDSLIAWLETRRADGEYLYSSHSSCLIANYLRYQGHSKIYVDCLSYQYHGQHAKPLPKGWDAIARGADWRLRSTHTYGQALERAMLTRTRELENA